MEVFSEEWMREYAQLWNAERAMVQELTRQRFNAAVGYGFLDQPAPRSLLVVVRGVAEQAGYYDGRQLDWDLRASAADWNEWLEQGFDLSRLLIQLLELLRCHPAVDRVQRGVGAQVLRDGDELGAGVVQVLERL